MTLVLTAAMQPLHASAAPHNAGTHACLLSSLSLSPLSILAEQRVQRTCTHHELLSHAAWGPALETPGSSLHIPLMLSRSVQCFPVSAAHSWLTVAFELHVAGRQAREGCQV